MNRQNWRRYAFLYVGWPEAEWTAVVTGDAPGIRLLHHLHTDACYDGSCSDGNNDKETTAETVAEALELARAAQRAIVTARLQHNGAPDVIDMVVEPTGDSGSLKATMEARPWWPAPATKDIPSWWWVAFAAAPAVLGPPLFALKHFMFAAVAIGIIGCALAVAIGWNIMVLHRSRFFLAAIAGRRRQRLLHFFDEARVSGSRSWDIPPGVFEPRAEAEGRAVMEPWQPMNAWDGARGARGSVLGCVFFVALTVTGWALENVPLLVLCALVFPIASLATYTKAALRDGAPLNAPLGWHLRRLALIAGLLVAVAAILLAIHRGLTA